MKLEDEIFQKEFSSEFQKAFLNILFTYNCLRGFQEKILKPYGLTSQQYNILRILRGQHPNPSTIKLIRERMLDKMSDCSRIVEKLRVKGLVERKVCSSDRRNVDVVISQKGLNVLSGLDFISEEHDKLFSNLDEKEAKELNRILDKLRENEKFC